LLLPRVFSVSLRHVRELPNKNNLTVKGITMDTQSILVEPTIVAPTIHSSAVLAEFSVSVWSGRKKDKRASAQVTMHNNARSGTANVHKKLLGDCAELKAVTDFVAKVRLHHYALTMPWADLGQRLVPTAMLMDYTEQMSSYEQEFHRLVQEFLDVYEWEIVQARARLGSLFDNADYTSTDDLRHKFAYKVAITPVPSSGDFRVDLGNEVNTMLQTSFQEHYQEQLTKAMSDVYNRTRIYLERLYRSLDYNEGERRPKLVESTFDGVLDMIELLGICNLTGDVQMEAIRAKLENQFRGVGKMPLSSEALRHSSHVRAETKAVVKDVIKTLPTIDL